jgi:hypothetical protein
MGWTSSCMVKLNTDLSTKRWPQHTNKDHPNPTDPISLRRPQHGLPNYLGPWNATESHQNRPRLRLPTRRTQWAHVYQCNSPQASLLRSHPTDATHRCHFWQWCKSSLQPNDTVTMHDPLHSRRSLRRRNRNPPPSSQRNQVQSQDSTRCLPKLVPKHISPPDSRPPPRECRSQCYVDSTIHQSARIRWSGHLDIL